MNSGINLVPTSESNRISPQESIQDVASNFDKKQQSSDEFFSPYFHIEYAEEPKVFASNLNMSSEPNAIDTHEDPAFIITAMRNFSNSKSLQIRVNVPNSKINEKLSRYQLQAEKFFKISYLQRCIQMDVFNGPNLDKTYITPYGYTKEK